jgi:cytochrome c
MVSAWRRALVAWSALAGVTAYAAAPGAASAIVSATVSGADFDFGRPVDAAEIRQWDIDVTPTGEGLPAGRGDVEAGAAVYRQKCLACHGENGRGGTYDQLVAPWQPGVDYAAGSTPRTIGNYWPFATTLYDYIARAMPQTEPGSLTPDEVYALTAYLLHLNGIVGADAVMDADTLPGVEMPARRLFYRSDEVPAAR